MSLVAHKYTPAEMPENELESTFAARDHTLEFLLKSLRDQIHSGTLSSFVITGPRGAGKSTLIHMVDLRIRKDPELNAAWLPVVFPEEQFNIASLRDLLAAALQVLAKDGTSSAQSWLDKVEGEGNDEQSLQLAMTGLREVTRETGKRLVLFVENMDILFGESLDDQMKGTLRRLLMSDPFMMLIGSAVHMFDSLKRYDEAFFNYFDQVPLGRLTFEQVSELLRKRAEYDDNVDFLRNLPALQAKVRTLVHLTGGNPRLVLMLYELLSERQVTTIVAYLRRLVDELTPLLKDEMENLPPQQRKIIHALMEKGGTAQPTDLVGPTRLPLNAINTQLKRLKDAQFVEVLGGGKGRAANYTVPDKLFAIWYQMRYLSQNRRRIELFVEVLRIWFEEEQRLATLRKLAEPPQACAHHVLREDAASAEYFAASLKGTTHEHLATELCINLWVKADLREAAMAYADFSKGASDKALLDEMGAYAGLGNWLSEHGDYQNAVQSLDEVIANKAKDSAALADAFIKRGFAKSQLGQANEAVADYTAAIEVNSAPKECIAVALFNRAFIRSNLGDSEGQMADYSAVIELKGTPKIYAARALVNRGTAKRAQGELQGAVIDYTTAIELKGAPEECVARALINRGIAKKSLGDVRGAVSDYTAVVELKGAPKDQIGRALINRGVTKAELADMDGAIADSTAVIDLEGVPKDIVAYALVNRGCDKGVQGDMQGAIADGTAVVNLEGAPKEQIARALVVRGIAKGQLGNLLDGKADFITAIESGITDFETIAKAAEIAFKVLWAGGDEVGAKAVLTKFATALSNGSKEQRRAATFRFFSRLALPATKIAWPIAWRLLTDLVQPEIKEALKLLEPVCAVLEGKDRKILDSLPPEQREFAEQVLKKFEPNSET